MIWRRESLQSIRLYAITDLRREDSSITTTIQRVLEGGVDAIQLRSKHLSDKSLIELGTKIREITKALNKLFIVNDRVDLMQAIDADGVHLGQDDLPIGLARRMIGDRNKVIGQSTHSVDQAVQAEREGADYIGFGPLFPTPTKPDYRPVGLGVIGDVLQRVRIPVICIGGIDHSNVRSVLEAGANRIAVVRAIFSAADPYQSAFDLKGLMT